MSDRREVSTPELLAHRARIPSPSCGGLPVDQAAPQRRESTHLASPRGPPCIISTLATVNISCNGALPPFASLGLSTTWHLENQSPSARKRWIQRRGAAHAMLPWAEAMLPKPGAWGGETVCVRAPHASMFPEGGRISEDHSCGWEALKRLSQHPGG